MTKIKSTITLTFGEQAENNVGMEKLGNGVDVMGFSNKKLFELYKKLKDEGYKTKIIDLNKGYKKKYPNMSRALVLVCKNYVKNNADIDPTELFNEQKKLEWDKKALMRGRVVNKKARYNLCYDVNSQEPNYEKGKGRIISYSDLPLTSKLRDSLNQLSKEYLDNDKDLYCEGNYYYDNNVCGIGFHGDGERKKVIGIRLGNTMPLYYQWYYKNERIGEKRKINLSNGDMYIMSEKASGFDWKKRNIYTLRHAAGCDNFTK